MTYEIKHKNETLLATAQSLTYSSKRMGEEFVTVTLRVSAPIDFQIGDYITYRGNNYYLNVTPTVKKKARNGSAGDAFVYDNIKFESASVELVNTTFRDVVIADNQLHTAMPAFSFMTNTAADLADRIKANLDALGSGWTVVVTDAVRNGLEGKKNINISVDNINCWEALALINSEFDVNFSVSGKTITVGKVENVLNAEAMRYGLGNGLATIEKTTDDNQQIITRLRAYGNTTNMPTRYYANLGAKCYLPIVSASVTAYKKEWIDNGTLYNELAKNEYYGNNPRFLATVIGTVFTDSEVVGKRDGVLFMASGTMDYAPSLFNATDSQTKTAEFSDINGNKFIATFYYFQGEYGSATYFVTETMSEADLKAMTRLTLRDSVNVDAWPVANKEGKSNMPNNMHIDRLMLPSFPNNLDPYVQDDALVAEYGVREATVFFDGSNGLDDIYPTIKNVAVNVLSATGYEGNGIYGTDTTSETVPPFTIRIAFDQTAEPFNPWEYKIAGETAYISMTSGMNQGRQFEITGCTKVEDRIYELTCKRQEETAFSRYFPYNDYPIRESDTFVFLGISMPDSYISAAAEKLQEAAEKYLAENSKVKYNYSLNLSSIFMQKQVDAGYNWHETICAGQSVVFEDPDIIGSDALSIPIESLEIKEGTESLPKYSIVLSDSTQASTLSKVQSQITSVASQSITTLYPLAIKSNGRLVGTYNPAERGLTVELNGGGGGNVEIANRLDSWDDYDESKAEWLLSALLGVDLKERVEKMEGKKFYIGTTPAQDEPAPQSLDGITAIDDIAHFDEENRRMGIGTATPEATLHVDGKTKLEGEVDATGQITAENGVQFGKSFAEGLTGYGGYIDKNGFGWLGGLSLRNFLEVPELRFNRVDVKVGDKWRAPGAGICEEVTTSGNTGHVKLKLETGEIGAVAVGDLCMGIFHNELDTTVNSTNDYDDGKGNRRFAGFFTAYFEITSVTGTLHTSFDYKLRAVSENWPFQYHPCEAMHFVAFGNRTNVDRQTSVYETRTYTRMLQKQNDWEIAERNIAMQYGDMSLFKTAFNKDLKGYSMYLNNIYLKGNLKHIKSGDDDEEVNTLNWLTQEPSDGHYDYNDVIYYAGQNWRCVNENGTYAKPSADSADWFALTQSNDINVQGIYEYGKHYEKGSIVSYNGSMWMANEDTDLAPLPLLRYKNGDFVTLADGSHVLVSEEQDEEHKRAWGIMFSTEGIKDGKDGESLYVEYSVDGKTNWHSGFTNGDIYMRQKLGESGQWSNAMRVVGETGADGENGEYVDFQFAVSTSLTVAPATGWQDAPPAVGSGQYLWMRKRRVHGDGSVEPWYTARIGGETGNGVDDIGEWYKASSKDSGETFSPSSHADWSHTIPALDATKKYLWNVEEIGMTDGTKSYTSPAVIAIWTKDGKGIKQIIEHYLATSASSGVTRSTAGWTTTIQFTSATKRYLWNYEEIVYTEGANTYTEPAIIGVHGQDGKDGEVRLDNLGMWKTGLQVGYLDLVRMGNGTFQCVNKSGTTNAPYGIYTDKDGNRLQYKDGRYVLNGYINYGTGKDYQLVAMDGADGKTGENGVDGRNGEDIEYVYLVTSDEKQTHDIKDESGTSAYQQDDFLPKTSSGVSWTDNPSGVTATNRVEWMALRRKTGGSGGKGGTWGKFTNPTLWSAYGERGQDGDGVEYVFLRTTTETKPTLWSDQVDSATYQQDDYCPYTTSAKTTRWTDDPTGVNVDIQYEWVSQRTSKNGKWGAFSPVALWSKFAKTPVKGVDYVDGQDAVTAQLSTSSVMVLTDINGKVKGDQPFNIGATLSVGNVVNGIDYLSITSYDSNKFTVTPNLSGGYYVGIKVTAKDGASGLASNTSFINFTVGKNVSGKRIDIPLSLAVTGTVAGAQGYNGCSIRAREWSEFSKEFTRTITGTRSDYTSLTSSVSHALQLVFSYVTGRVRVEEFVYTINGVERNIPTKPEFVCNGTANQTFTIVNATISKNYTVKISCKVRFMGSELTSSSFVQTQTYYSGTYKQVAYGKCLVTTEKADGSYDDKNVIRQYYFNESDVTSKGYGTRYIDIVLLEDSENASGYQAYQCKHSHFANQYNKPKSTKGGDPNDGYRTWDYYWTEADVQPFIQTDMLFAKHAKMVFASGNQILLQDASENVVGGMSGFGTDSNQIRLWLGRENPADAPFQVTEQGELYAEKGVFKGALYSTFARSNNATRYDKLYPYTEDVVELPTGQEHIGRRISIFSPFITTRTYAPARIKCSRVIFGKPVRTPEFDEGVTSYLFPTSIELSGGVLELLAVPYGNDGLTHWVMVGGTDTIQRLLVRDGETTRAYYFGVAD